MYAVTVNLMCSLINTVPELILHVVCNCPISSCLSENITGRFAKHLKPELLEAFLSCLASSLVHP